MILDECNLAGPTLCSHAQYNARITDRVCNLVTQNDTRTVSDYPTARLKWISVIWSFVLAEPEKGLFWHCGNFEPRLNLA